MLWTPPPPEVDEYGFILVAPGHWRKATEQEKWNWVFHQTNELHKKKLFRRPVWNNRAY